MNHDELASKAAHAIGVTPHSDMRPFVEQAVKWALNEAALYAAEPVAWGNFKSDGTLVGLAEERPDSWTGAKPLYAAPPAPSVAVKAIEAVWKYSLVIESSVRRGDGPDQYAGVTEALRLVKEARSALSAQVQDVAGWQLVPVEPSAGMIAAAQSTTSAALTRSHATEIYRAMLAAAPAKQEGDTND